MSTIAQLADISVSSFSDPDDFGAAAMPSGFPQARSQTTAQTLLDSLDISFTVGETDVVEGKISIGEGKTIVISGTVIGEIHSKGSVVLMKGGKILGNVSAAQIWLEGDISAAPGSNQPARIDVGYLHLGQNARIVADCVYDMMSMESPNRGIRGRLECRQVMEDNNG